MLFIVLQLASDVDEEFKELHSTLDDLQMHTMNYAAALASRYRINIVEFIV